jgi:hypothetical protein
VHAAARHGIVADRFKESNSYIHTVNKDINFLMPGNKNQVLDLLVKQLSVSLSSAG